LFIGHFKYQPAFGPKSPTEKMDLNSTFVYASCTKLLTSIAVLQCVERGQIGLDDDIGELITEFKDAKIMTGFEGEEGNEKPVLKDVEGKITLR
jgi:CubicO group peptidase (beta-lactamase class C family)